MRSTLPPSWALRLLQRALPPELRESVSGDLLEEWQGLAGRAPLRARWWFWGQALLIAFRFYREGLANRKGRAAPWQAPAIQGDSPMEILWRDVRYGLRMLARTPAFALVAILTLGLAIGANTAIFSVVHTLLIRPLPYPDSEQLVQVAGMDQRGRPNFISYLDFQDFRHLNKTFDSMSALVGQSVNLTGREEPTRVIGGFVSANFFDMVRVQPAQGRGFRAGEDEPGAAPVAVINHGTWKSVFGGDTALIGKSITLNNTPFTVVGILPEGFTYEGLEVWMTYQFWPNFQNNRTSPNVGPVGRLKPGVSTEQARAELDTIAAQLVKQYPEANRQWSRLNMQSLRESRVGDVRPAVLVLMGAVGFVLLIACANVANLLLARSAARSREMATRAALGAGRWRLVAQSLTETGLLWFFGGALGLAFGWWGLEGLMALAPVSMPDDIPPTLNGSVLLFTLELTVLTAMLFGLAPALRSSRPDLHESLKEGGRAGAGAGRSRVRGALVVAQIALALVLLIGSGLMLRSFQKLTHVEAGFQADGLLTMEYRVPRNKYPEGAQQWEFHRKVVERIQALPGVRAAAGVRALPFSGNGGTSLFVLPGREEPPAGAEWRAQTNEVHPDYFKTMGIPLLRGRFITEQDHADAPVAAVINQTMAQQFWPGQDPVGHTIRLPGARRNASGPPSDIEATIVGVVGDIKHFSLEDPTAYQIYGAQAQVPFIFSTLVVRTEGDPMKMANAVRSAVWSVDKDQPVWKIRTLDFLVHRSVGLPRFLMTLLSVYSGLALLLAAIGIYGVMAYAVTQRTHEIGVRMALGAQTGDVLGLILRHGMLLTSIGVTLGIAGAFALSSVVQKLLFQVEATDASTFAAVAAVLAGVALLATYIPARRATRVDPVIALRYE